MSASREHRIAELRSACGCKEGMIALAIGVTAYAISLRYFPVGDTTLQRLLLGVAAGLGSAVIGKLFGLLVAHVRLRLLLREIGTVPLRARLPAGHDAPRTRMDGVRLQVILTGAITASLLGLPALALAQPAIAARPADGAPVDVCAAPDATPGLAAARAELLNRECATIRAVNSLDRSRARAMPLARRCGEAFVTDGTFASVNPPSGPPATSTRSSCSPASAARTSATHRTSPA